MAEPQPAGSAKRGPHFITPCMGRTSRVTPSSGALVRGLYSRPGVADGDLFVAAGTQLYRVSTAWAATALGPLQGAAGTVLFDNIGSNLIALAGGSIYQWDSTNGLRVSTDEDTPMNAYTLASLGDRALSSAEGSDQFDWSDTGSAVSWPASGFATSGRQPDEILNQTVLGGDLWHFGSNSTQLWRAVGGDDADAFDILSVTLDRGIIGRDAIAKLCAKYDDDYWAIILRASPIAKSRRLWRR